MSSISLRTRLLTGLLISLTLVVAAGCAGIYWLQRELLSREFDSQLSRRGMAAFREVRRLPSSQPAKGPDAEEVPEGLVFVQIWDLAANVRERAIPVSLDLGKDPPVPVPQTDRPEVTALTLPDGRSLRVLAWRMGRPPRRPPSWDPNGRRMDAEGPDGPWPGFMRRPPTPSDANWHRPDAEGPDGPWPGFLRPPPPPRDANAHKADAGAPDGPRPGPMHRPGPPSRERLLLAGADLAPMHASLRQWLLRLLAAGAVGEALVAAVVLIAVQRGLRPLRVLSADIAAIGDGDLARRVSLEDLPGEVKPVVRQINALLSRLEDAFDRERAFTASAAHEFRTPLAGIRAQMEVCLRRSRTSGEYQDTLARCLEAAVSLQQMVDLLLDLAHLDGGEVRPRAEILDVSSLVRTQWRRFEPAALARGCSVRMELPEVLGFPTDGFMLERIVSNLLANAAEYTDPGGTIEVLLQGDGDRLRFGTRNPAKAIEPPDLDRLFDRFWRKDAARAQTGHHCGLGLSLVQRCVHVLGGTVQAELDDGCLVSLTVDLPACQSPEPAPDHRSA